MTLPSAFISNPRQLTTFDAVNIATGRIFQIFYGALTHNAAVAEYVIVDVIVSSGQPHLASGSSSSAPYESVFAQDFDLEFKVPTTIDGEMTISIPIGMDNTGQASNAGTRVTYTIIHVDAAASETDIVAASVGDITEVGAAKLAYTATIKESITNQLFKVGEKLRVKIDLNARSVGGDTMSWGLGHDPLNRDGTPITSAFVTGDRTQMIFAIPIKPNF